MLAVAIPALGQDSPQSILPPGFGDTTPAPGAANRTSPPAPAPPSSTVPIDPARTLESMPGAGASPDEAAAAADAAARAAAVANADIPIYARRSSSRIGIMGVDTLVPQGFGRANGRFLETLMRHLDTPIASRWLEIVLRRALLSPVATPAGVSGADFAAERSWLLLRLGESVAARALVQAVDPGDYTPKLYQVAMQAALATGDPAGTCTLADAATSVSDDRGWVLAQAICAGLAGQAQKAQMMFAAARKQRIAGGVDLLLAQKLGGAGATGRQAVAIEWQDVDRLTAWRYGLATAGGVDIPPALLATASPAVAGWRVLSPALDPRTRIGLADAAAVRGLLSNAALVDLYTTVAIGDDDAIPETAVARDLRTAYDSSNRQARIEALKTLWSAPSSADGRYARLILTARAAARLPTDSRGADADRVVAAMLSAGLDRSALRWRARVADGGQGWALLALADPQPRPIGYAAVRSFVTAGDPSRGRQMLFAGLAGLGRMTTDDVDRGARGLDVAIGAQNVWTEALARAALAHQPGTVLLLAATGMQTSQWRGVSPETLYHVVMALRAVGLDGEARMIAAEAVTRL